MRSFAKLLTLLLLPALLAACSAERGNFTTATQTLGLGIGYEIVKVRAERSLEVTCNAMNLLSDGSYCVSNYKPTDRQEVFCFKTLGGVDCYAERDPYSLEGRALPAAPRLLADPPMPMTPPGRRNPPQVAVAPVGAEPATDPVGETPAEIPEIPANTPTAPVLPRTM